MIYDILSRKTIERFHRGEKCSRTFTDGKWIGKCFYCDSFISLMKKSYLDLARKLKPIEKHTYVCRDGNLFTCGKTVAQKIGNRTGKFVVVRRFVAGFPCYDDSHFVE
jgi:hypothetical protein